MCWHSASHTSPATFTPSIISVLFRCGCSSWKSASAVLFSHALRSFVRSRVTCGEADFHPLPVARISVGAAEAGRAAAADVGGQRRNQAGRFLRR